jgi:hypothetical protein
MDTTMIMILGAFRFAPSARKNPRIVRAVAGYGENKRRILTKQLAKCEGAEQQKNRFRGYA